jgi:hypothetical protein
VGWIGGAGEGNELEFFFGVLVTLFFSLSVQQADGRGARRVCDSSDDDHTERQSGNTSSDRLLSGDVRVSASLSAERQSAMVGSSATRLNCGGDFAKAPRSSAQRSGSSAV